MSPKRRFLRLCPALVLIALCMLGAWARQHAAGSAGTTQPATQPATAEAQSQPAASQPATAPASAPASSQAAMRRVHVFVSGRVQGVGFRDFTKAQAASLGLTGWVRNLRDGRVEAVIEGPGEKVDKLLEKIRTGPSRARVDGLELDEGTYAGEFDAFKVTQ